MIESFLFVVLGNLVIKSMVITSHFFFGIGNGKQISILSVKKRIAKYDKAHQDIDGLFLSSLPNQLQILLQFNHKRDFIDMIRGIL